MGKGAQHQCCHKLPFLHLQGGQHKEVSGREEGAGVLRHQAETCKEPRVGSPP